MDTLHSYDRPCNGIGYVTFTGPDGLRDNRPQIAEDAHVIGIGDQSTEASSDSAYLFRPAPGTPFAPPKALLTGEIGWGIPWLTDFRNLKSGQQIMMGTFRQIAEDRSTHSDTAPWYPSPDEETPPGSQGYYKENIYSGRPGTCNPNICSPQSGSARRSK